MTIGHDLELQGAIDAALKASAELKTLIGNPVRVYQDVPASPKFPYVTIGNSQTLDASNQCMTASEIFADVHVWSTASGLEEVKKIAAVIRATLHEAALTMAESRLFAVQFRDYLTLRDPDGVTKHIVLRFRAFVEATA
jgi:hypothetical protein